MSLSWSAVAVAVESSDRTFAATAALTGTATLASTNDIASRSGSSAASSAANSSGLSSSRVWIVSVIPAVLLLLVTARAVADHPFGTRADRSVPYDHRLVCGRLGRTVRPDVASDDHVRGIHDPYPRFPFRR